MKFSINVGGLIYNVDSLTEEFYEKKARLFECPYEEKGYALPVTEELLYASPFFDRNLNIYLNETTYLLDKVIRHCLDYNRLIIHGSCLSYKNNGYLFIGKSGTGKTTHTKLWKKYLKDDVTIINGDKPMLEFNESIIVHGTPWMGKENFGVNDSVPLKAIVVLKQSPVNSIKRLSAKDSVVPLLQQCFYADDEFSGVKVVRYVEKIIREIPVFKLECDISEDAFETCLKGVENL